MGWLPEIGRISTEEKMRALPLFLYMCAFSYGFIKNNFMKIPWNRIDTKLNVDVFGVGPTEFVIICAVGFFLYGPNRVKKQLNGKGIIVENDGKSLKAQCERRIAEGKYTLYTQTNKYTYNHKLTTLHINIRNKYCHEAKNIKSSWTYISRNWKWEWRFTGQDFWIWRTEDKQK